MKDPATRAEGMAWYDTAHGMAAADGKQYGIGTDHAAAVIAALSPQMEWGRNTQLAEKTMAAVADGNRELTVTHEDVQRVLSLRSAKPFASDIAAAEGTHAVADLPTAAVAAFHPDLAGGGQTLGNQVKAVALARGANISDTLGGNKVRNFFNNIDDPKQPYVTIDTHQIHAMSAEPKAVAGYDNNAISSPARYDVFAGAVRSAAADRGVTPAQMQAVVWTGWRKEH